MTPDYSKIKSKALIYKMFHLPKKRLAMIKLCVIYGRTKGARLPIGMTPGSIHVMQSWHYWALAHIPNSQDLLAPQIQCVPKISCLHKLNIFSYRPYISNDTTRFPASQGQKCWISHVFIDYSLEGENQNGCMGTESWVYQLFILAFLTGNYSSLPPPSIMREYSTAYR